MVFLKSKFANSADFFKKWKKPDACNFIKKETLAQVFSCEFCEISKNILQNTSSDCFNFSII